MGNDDEGENEEVLLCGCTFVLEDDEAEEEEEKEGAPFGAFTTFEGAADWNESVIEERERASLEEAEERLT